MSHKKTQIDRLRHTIIIQRYICRLYFHIEVLKIVMWRMTKETVKYFENTMFYKIIWKILTFCFASYVMLQGFTTIAVFVAQAPFIFHQVLHFVLSYSVQLKFLRLLHILNDSFNAFFSNCTICGKKSHFSNGVVQLPQPLPLSLCWNYNNYHPYPF